MFGDSSHNATLGDYRFHPGPLYREFDGAGHRAVFDQFQGFPQNDVKGMAQLTRGAPGGAPGKYWRVLQPPQATVYHRQVRSDLLGGGTDHGTLQLQPLVQNQARSNDPFGN